MRLRLSGATLLAVVSLSRCHAYFAGEQIVRAKPGTASIDVRGWRAATSTRPLGKDSRPVPTCLFSSSSEAAEAPSGELLAEIVTLCGADEFGKAIEVLQKESTGAHLKSCYATILKSLAKREEQVEEQRRRDKASVGIASSQSASEKEPDRHLLAGNILDALLELGDSNDELLPTNEDFNTVIKMWGSSTYLENASTRCAASVEELWRLYDKKREERYVPLKESYLYTIKACSQRDRSGDAAKLAERMMSKMKSLSEDYPHLTPDRSIANEVINAWGKSGRKYEQGLRSQSVLEKMIENATSEDRDGEMIPDTKSFNIVLNALAQGRERESEVRAEELLQRMEVLSLTYDCKPDNTSFNTVLNGWASSRHRGSAQRAIAILEHMKKRYDAGLTKVHPDESTYNTVLKALAKSRDEDAINQAESIFEEYLEACESGKLNLSHNAFTYNSMMNCYARSNHPEAAKRSMELFETMKANSGKPGWELCFVDVFTYNTLINVISKEESYDASEQAISLLKEFEQSFAETGDVRFRPNIRLYTSVVKAIGRSKKNTQRAQDIVDRVESSYIKGLTHWEGKPDVSFYNALINAYGWSDMEGRSEKCLGVLKHMVSLFESGTLDDAKPDTVSFNSILNACAHETAKGQSKSDSIMKIAVETFDLLNSSTEYGNPDQNTYVQVLICVATHMAKNDEKRSSMAEATFLQCAARGLVGPNIVAKLFAAVSNRHFKALMGPASYGGSKLRFDMAKLPSEWTQNAGSRQRRSSSRRRQQNFQVTKNVISNSKRRKQ